MLRAIEGRLVEPLTLKGAGNYIFISIRKKRIPVMFKCVGNSSVIYIGRIFFSAISKRLYQWKQALECFSSKSKLMVC